MNRTGLTLLLWFLSLVAGCAIPIPHTTEWAPEMSGRVLDAATGDPIAGVSLEYAWTHGAEDDEPIETFVTSGSDGSFDLPALKQRHWGYMFAVALNYSLPCPKWGRGAWVTVEHPGYLLWERQIDPKTAGFEYAEGIQVELTPTP